MNKRFIFILLGCMFSFLSVTAYAQEITIKGVVLDETELGLPGANIIVKGGKVGTATDLDGNFSLTVPSSNSVIVVSYIGYESQEIKVGDKREFRIQMSNNTQLIDEVVIVGFGTQKKINATGAVKTIDNTVLEARPVSNAVQGLQGAVAGLNITNDQGGALGQEMNINIRGIGSIGEGSSSSPLVLIDGMEGDLSSLNPNDIENISVLKDAAAASIYGSRAPFGVILVTTKSGERGLRVNYTGNLRISQPISVPESVDSYEYALMVNDAFINSGGSAQFSDTQLKKILAYQRGEIPYGIEQAEGQNDWAWGQRSFANTDWYDVYLKNFTTSQEHNFSVSGGGDKVTYYVSANYLGQTGLFNFADETYSRLALNGKVGIKFNDYVSFNWSTRLITTDNNKPSAMDNLFFHNLGRRSPLMPVTMPNGEYNKESLIPSISEGGRIEDKNQLLYNQASLVVEPIKGWKIYADINSRLESPSYSRHFSKLQYTLPDGSTQYFPVLEGVADKTEIRENGTFNRQPPAGTSYYERAKGSVNYLQTNFYTDYEKTFNDVHYFKALLGAQTEYFFNETVRVGSDNVLLDDKPFINSVSDNIMISEHKGEWANMGFFGRVNYAYDDRYMAEINLRYDGASRFPSNQRWGVFPSFSLGWNVAREKFFSKLYDAGFEYFKLRGSYGRLGNQNTTSFYQFYQRMEAQPGNVVIGGSQASVLPMYSPYSTSLTWEKIENAGVGVDWGFLNNRLTGSFDWYQRRTLDMVGPAKALSAVYGGNAPKTNNAELRTRGWELEVSWRDRIGADFSYGISASLSDYKSVVTKYDSPDGKLEGTNGAEAYYQGKVLGDIWGYRVEGIAKSDKEMNDYLAHVNQSAIGSNWGGGDVMYSDLDKSGSIDPGSGTITDHGDMTIIGNATPRFAYSFTLEASYKFIDFRAFFQGIGKRDVFFKNSATFFGIVSPYQRSFSKDHLDYFRFAGSPLGANMDDPYYGRLRTDQNNIQVSDRYLQDASYLRLKNVQIGFNLPENTKLAKYVEKARLYVSGENLFTFTNLRIYDPEALGASTDPYGPGKTYPMYRVWSVGLELTF